MNKKLKSILTNKLKQGCINSVELIKANTPIDTQRLYESVDVLEVEAMENSQIRMQITLGGKNLYGVRREQHIKRDVNYAIYVEMKQPFIRPLLNQITQNILEQFNN